MTKTALAALTLPIALALTACEQNTAPADDPVTADTASTAAPGATPAAPAPGGTTAPTASATAAEGIPAALRGRWGLVPADCTSTRGDAKGLLTIGPKTLKFYESVGTLALETARSDSMLRGQFAFSGEGMTWTRDETLSVSGDKLTRTETGGDEPGSGGPFTYTKCAA
jgi:hypothetical protein